MKSTIIPKITRVYISVKRIADNYYEAKYKDSIPMVQSLLMDAKIFLVSVLEIKLSSIVFMYITEK